MRGSPNWHLKCSWSSFWTMCSIHTASSLDMAVRPSLRRVLYVASYSARFSGGLQSSRKSVISWHSRQKDSDVAVEFGFRFHLVQGHHQVFYLLFSFSLLIGIRSGSIDSGLNIFNHVFDDISLICRLCTTPS